MFKQNILFEQFSAAFANNVSQVHNICHIQQNHHSPAIAVFHPSTRERLVMLLKSCAGQADCVTGRVGPSLAQAFTMEAGPGWACRPLNTERLAGVLSKTGQCYLHSRLEETGSPDIIRIICHPILRHTSGHGTSSFGNYLQARVHIIELNELT